MFFPLAIMDMQVSSGAVGATSSICWRAGGQRALYKKLWMQDWAYKNRFSGVPDSEINIRDQIERHKFVGSFHKFSLQNNPCGCTYMPFPSKK